MNNLEVASMIKTVLDMEIQNKCTNRKNKITIYFSDGSKAVLTIKKIA